MEQCFSLPCSLLWKSSELGRCCIWSIHGGQVCPRECLEDIVHSPPYIYSSRKENIITENKCLVEATNYPNLIGGFFEVSFINANNHFFGVLSSWGGNFNWKTSFAMTDLQFWQGGGGAERWRTEIELPLRSGATWPKQINLGEICLFRRRDI